MYGQCSQHQLSGMPKRRYYKALEYRSWVLRMQHLRGEVQSVNQSLTLDVEALGKIAGYAHWIPVIRGLYKEFFSLNYPGWEWNHIIPVLIKKGIIKVYSKEIDQRYLAHGLSISKDVESVFFKRSKHGTKVTVHKIATN
jgi:hypothetical protein